MSALLAEPRLWWILLLVVSCAFALGVLVGVFGYRYVHGVPLPAVFRRMGRR